MSFSRHKGERGNKVPSRLRGSFAWRGGLVLFVAVFLAGREAPAHHGYESEPRISLLDNQTFAVVRMTAAVVARLMEGNVPVVWNDELVGAEQGRLQTLARSLLVIIAGQAPLQPLTASASLEVSGQLAFVVTYPAATKWPVTIEAAYFRHLGPECTGVMHVFGPPGLPTERSGPEIASLELAADRRSVEIPTRPVARP